ncbi:MAG: hypothetical protein U9Q21_00305 [Candidatus Auribacterota bacterium]|nr:hypothetical protein [Candidatus Auribacterota bacterium]
MKNIFFCGECGAGKSFAASYVRLKYGFLPIKLAAPLYQLRNMYFPGKDKRELFQFMGTDVGREQIGGDIWVDRFMQDTEIVTKAYQEFYSKTPYFVCDDVRAVNEYLYLINSGWVGVYLSAPEKIRIERLEMRDGDACVDRLSHGIEKEIESFKDKLIQIDSSGTLEEMCTAIDKVCEDEGVV